MLEYFFSSIKKYPVSASMAAVFFLLVLGFGAAKIVNAGTLSCSVRTSDCIAGDVEVFRLSGTANAHAQLPSVGTYVNRVCCGGVAGISNACSGIYATALQLSSSTNAHVQQSGAYVNNACISVPAGGSVSVGYAADCIASGYDTALASMNKTTNSHVGNPGVYSTNICVTSAAPVVSISISDGVINYGYMELNASSTNASDVQVITVGTGPANLHIKSTNFTEGAHTWTLGDVNGADQVKFEFSKDNASYSTFSAPDVLYSLDANVPASETRDLYLRLTTPLTTLSYNQFDAVITVVASAP